MAFINIINVDCIATCGNLRTLRNISNIDKVEMISKLHSQETVQSSGLFGLEQVQQDICNILLLEARKHCQFFDHTLNLNAIGVEKKAGEMAFWDFSLSADEIELTFADVESTEFAKVILDNFDYGFQAVTGTRSDDPMEEETMHSWFSAYILSLHGSAYVGEYEGYGNNEIREAIRRCLTVMELSNARRILEGHEPFYHFSQSDKKDEETARHGELTIRQLAMLSGMEEMSLRSHISRKNAPILGTRKQERRTIVDADVAREWLIAKNRYLVVKLGRRTRDLDLSVTQFNSVRELEAALQDRSGVIGDRVSDTKDKLKAVLQTVARGDLYEMSLEDYLNPNLITAIAHALELPPHWLILRAEEAVLKTKIFMSTFELEQVKRRVKEAAQQQSEAR